MIGTVPLVLLGIVLMAAMLLAYEGGLRLHRSISHRADGGNSESSDEGYVLSGVFGLLALLMAFAFSLALGRFDERRALAVAEANAIGTMASRLALVGADQQQPLRQALSDYASARVATGTAADTARWDRLGRDAGQLHDRFGSRLYQVIASGPADARTTLLVQAYDDLGDTAALRRSARAARLPEAVLALLAVYCMVGAGMLGYTIAASRAKHRIASGIFFLLLTAAFVTVLDLDRPRGGTIVVPQTELEDVARALARPA
ncbi:hypothetical protein ACFFF7_06475 [Novosphingobium aquiterrae]|uniref:DUF4239 domain-containing protein n=1 Tax=Novosphingobium aquiterrae TaxID=624388 RepID=A0ABV6PGU4_9SPHN